MNGRRQSFLNGRTALLLAGIGLICVVAVAGALEESVPGCLHAVAVVLLVALFLANCIWLSGGRAEKAPYRYIQCGSCIPVILYGCYVFGSLDFAVYGLFVQCVVMYLFMDLKLFRANEALTVITFLVLILSEEIRQPLYDLLGQSGELPEGERQGQVKSSDKMSGTGRRILSILNSITDYSKAQSGTLPLHTKDYKPQTVLELLQMVFGESVAEYKLDKNIPQWLHGDDVRLTQVLIYLLNRILQVPQYQEIKVSMTGMSESRQNYKLYCEIKAVGQDLPETIQQWGMSVMITGKILECMGSELTVEQEKKDQAVFSFALPQEVALSSSREDTWWFLDEFDSKVEI